MTMHPGELDDTSELETASFLQLLVMAVRAAFRAGYVRIPTHVINTTISVCGVFLLVSPLLMWIAWSAGVALLLWSLIAVCFTIIWLIAWVAPGEPF